MERYHPPLPPDTLLCFLPASSGGFIIPDIGSIIPEHTGGRPRRAGGTRRLVRVAEQRGSMSRSGLDRERKSGGFRGGWSGGEWGVNKVVKNEGFLSLPLLHGCDV